MSDLFVWTFPTYILAQRHATDAKTGAAILDEHLQFLVAEITPGGDQSVLLFTDSDLAERYRADCSRPGDLALVTLETPSRLRTFLEMAQQNYQFVSVDADRGTGRVARGAAIADVLPAFENPA